MGHVPGLFRSCFFSLFKTDHSYLHNSNREELGNGWAYLAYHTCFMSLFTSLLKFTEIPQSNVTGLLLRWSYASYFLPTVQQANGRVWISSYLLLELMCARMLISTHTLLCLASPHTPNFYCQQKCQEQGTAHTPTTPPNTAIDSTGAPSNDRLCLAPQKWFARSLILEITAKAHLHMTVRQAKTLRWEIVWASSR